MTTSLLVIIKDLLLATGLGLVIGLERKLVQKEAGMRTFALICLGSALFVLIPRLMMTVGDSLVNADSIKTLSQIIGQLVVGVGFLGAGVIIFEEQSGKLRGLTTAAIMWVTAAIGAAVGVGFYSVAVVTTGLVLLINLIILPIEKRMDRN
ncbi:MAG: putative Mg2+ transporter-C (MgtC) family protein [Patescibacteria group bacterium]|nr:putative Mg2+ transporter-C (MgtC) family protein [Patescibacteria group bacterium]